MVDASKPFLVTLNFGETTFLKGVHALAGGPNRPFRSHPGEVLGLSLAVGLGPVVSVYGLDLVEASPAIYVILPVCARRIDEVGC